MARAPVRHVALLRGINVGRAKRVAMADLRALVEGLGYGDVATHLNSGNVVFTAPATRTADPGPRIEQALARELGVAARVTALAAGELDRIVRANPLLGQATDPSRLLVAVLANAADRPKLDDVLRREWRPEAISAGPREAYLWMPDGVIASRLGRAVDRALGDAVTSRNWTTMLRLREMAGSSD